MQLGDRVKTKGFGEGTVVGFEKFTAAGNSYISSAQGERDRVLVALDNPKAWICANARNPHPYMMGSDFLEPMAAPRKTFTLPAGHKVELAPFVQMKPPTPLPELEDNNDMYDRMAEHFRIVGIRMGVLALFIFICLIYFR
ncbi:hypothetical protein UFOVP228_46 [uncultured Caudovirales phage]|uniref:Uncharacterized protein n=1 Tax=uncultured Caudovirales phage TaxID=2100421 RepID=A0A6J7WSY9_9CAUD|nr:hypothetical protein UFOVP47_56 [uncultured Caudovirales phage]CAB5219254.1 hypothetical protein UFOVP228_46 [uncultured Caudovirales phage]